MNHRSLIFMHISGRLPILALLLFISCNRKHDFPIVTTIAGTGLMGTTDGPGKSASFSNPMGIALDETGNIYVADSRNNLIRKISADGTVTTVAGTGAAGSADGRADRASFFYPTGIAVDNKGNIYVADTHNNLIRTIGADGFVTTLAGSRIYNTSPGLDTTQRFDNPAGIAVDSLGNVYVADWANNLIRKISPIGKISTIAGNGNRGSKDSAGIFASFYLPGGIAVDKAGYIYVADTYNNLIRKISPDGMVSTLAGNRTKGSVNGKGKAASFLHPSGITVGPGGNLYVADIGNHKIRQITPDGTVTTFAGSGRQGADNGRDTVASFFRPNGIAADKKGDLYVADYLNNMIRRINY